MWEFATLHFKSNGLRIVSDGELEAEGASPCMMSSS